MLGTYYYHEIIRKTIIAFGTLFNTIDIKHKKQDGSAYSTTRIPIAYGPREKFLARLEQKPDLRSRVAITLPRLAFELTSIQYDNERKVSTMQTFKTLTSGTKKARKVYMPVPYNLGFRLNVMTEFNEDSLQIIEQILPVFQPSFNLTIDLVEAIGEKRDVPMVLENVTFDDNYESGMEEKRVITHTLEFNAKTYLFGNVPSAGTGLIKKVQVDKYTDTSNTKTASRELRYVAEPRALKDYNSDATTNLAEDITATKTQFNVANAGGLSVNGYIDIGEELMMIKTISGNTLTVKRGSDGTTKSSHINGDAVNIVNTADDVLVELGDDFGFSEQRFDYGGDGRVWSPTKGTDV